jgi:hypothetical protein
MSAAPMLPAILSIIVPNGDIEKIGYLPYIEELLKQPGLWG